MKVSPRLQLLIAAIAGAIASAATDALINGSSGGVLKGAGLLAPLGVDRGLALLCSWAFFSSLGPVSYGYFRPLTGRSAFALAFGLAAVLSVLIPNP